jgi:signal transduction histidine kinase
MARARSTVDECLAETRRLIADLRPALLDHMGLKRAVLAYAEDQLAPRGAKVECDLSGLRRQLPNHVEIAVFRILQEAISNVVKHSEASEVTIRLSAGDRYVSGSISDNGKGFRRSNGASSPEDSIKGRRLGLVGIRERVSLLGGALTVTSREGLGATVSFVIPVHGG